MWHDFGGRILGLPLAELGRDKVVDGVIEDDGGLAVVPAKEYVDGILPSLIRKVVNVQPCG